MSPLRTLLLAAAALVAVWPAAGAPSLPEELAAVMPLLQPPRRMELETRAGVWARWSEAERRGFAERAESWARLPPAERARRREHYGAWQALPRDEQDAVRAAAATFRALSPDEQDALRSRFERLEANLRRGWLLGPSLGADYPALHALLAQVPEAEHAPLRKALRRLSPVQRQDLAVIVQRTPPQQRAALRRELLSTDTAQLEDWLTLRLQR